MKKMKNLICWCCCAMFTGLQDVNHDDGYWLCIDCTREQEQDNENQYEEIYKDLSLSEKVEKRKEQKKLQAIEQWRTDWKIYVDWLGWVSL